MPLIIVLSNFHALNSNSGQTQTEAPALHIFIDFSVMCF